MTSPASGHGRTMLVLQGVTVALLAVVAALLWLGRNDARLEELLEEVETVHEDVSDARYEMQAQADRMAKLGDEIAARAGSGGAADQAGGAMGAAAAALVDGGGVPLAQRSTEELLERVIELHEMYSRYANDPVQREPVANARAAIESELRSRGDRTIDALAESFGRTQDTRAQRRLLEQLVLQIGTEAAHDFALAVFRDPAFVSGVRLVAARVALERHEDAVVEELARLLGTEDPTFLHRNDIALFFKENPDPRALPVLARLAEDPAVDRMLRRFCMQALSSYEDATAVEALKNVCLAGTEGELRAQALHSLHEILGEDVLDFIAYLRTKLAEDDSLRTLADNIEAYYRG